MELMFVPGREGRGRQVCVSTNVDCMHVGMALDDESRPFPSLTVHYFVAWEWAFMQTVATEMRRMERKPEVYLREGRVRADVCVTFSVPLSAGFVRFLRTFLSVRGWEELLAAGIDDEVVILAGADFDYERGPAAFGLREFLELHRETGCFYVSVCDDHDPNLSPNRREFRLETINRGLPPVLTDS